MSARKAWELIGPALLVVVIAFVGSLTTGSLEFQLRVVLVTASIVVALHVFVGNSGVLSFGHVSFVALGAIVCGVIFSFNLGVWFSAAMVLFASIAILYDTSNILHNYRTDQYVAAALSLFGSIAMLFWYILRIFMSRE